MVMDHYCHISHAAMPSLYESPVQSALQRCLSRLNHGVLFETLRELLVDQPSHLGMKLFIGVFELRSSMPNKVSLIGRAFCVEFNEDGLRCLDVSVLSHQNEASDDLEILGCAKEELGVGFQKSLALYSKLWTSKNHTKNLISNGGGHCQ